MWNKYDKFIKQISSIREFSVRAVIIVLFGYSLAQAAALDSFAPPPATDPS